MITGNIKIINWFIAIESNSFVEALASTYLGCTDFKKYKAGIKNRELVEVANLLYKTHEKIRQHKTMSILVHNKYESFLSIVSKGQDLLHTFGGSDAESETV